MLRASREGKTMMIHCMFGQSRSVSVVVAFLMSPEADGGLGVCFNCAHRYIVERRPQININTGFVGVLKDMSPKSCQHCPA
eukprot:NODE_10466_length_334_cov_39.192982_g9554_i0.p1 GENE.NODE_10466_length_334_cov_39.192982_g9554_i0~~NODE_10466_length_334_cov_39.192982_g9554_i0.p1  ORF type:complete len:81 (+),score=19.84 NODE_10466_length_334_cov_39.192982_g9554_i0:52-294(+)